MQRWPLVLGFCLSGATACGGKDGGADSGASPAADPEQDAFTDTGLQPDLDSDTDTDVDVDADADADTDSDTDADTDTDTDTAPPADLSDGTYGEVYEDVFFPHCSACHSGAEPAGGLDFSDQAASYSALMAGYVSAGNSGESLVYQRMTQEAGEAGVMPPTGPINSEWTNMVAAWIDNGALE